MRQENTKASCRLEVLRAAVDAAYNVGFVTFAEFDLPSSRIVFLNPASGRMGGYDLERDHHNDRNGLDDGLPFESRSKNDRKYGAERIKDWMIAPVPDEEKEARHYAVKDTISGMPRASGGS